MQPHKHATHTSMQHTQAHTNTHKHIAQSKQDRTGQDNDRAGQDRTGQGRTGQEQYRNRTGQDRTGHDRTRQDRAQDLYVGRLHLQEMFADLVPAVFSLTALSSL